MLALTSSIHTPQNSPFVLCRPTYCDSLACIRNIQRALSNQRFRSRRLRRSCFTFLCRVEFLATCFACIAFASQNEVLDDMCSLAFQESPSAFSCFRACL